MLVGFGDASRWSMRASVSEAHWVVAAEDIISTRRCSRNWTPFYVCINSLSSTLLCALKVDCQHCREKDQTALILFLFLRFWLPKIENSASVLKWPIAGCFIQISLLAQNKTTNQWSIYKLCWPRFIFLKLPYEDKNG